jgi:hypothetical protein
MRDLAPATNPGLQPTTVFRAALGAAAGHERGRQARRRDRLAAVAGLADDDLGRLIGTFEALLHGPAEVGALTAELHAALRDLSPAGRAEGDDDA